MHKYQQFVNTIQGETYCITYCITYWPSDPRKIPDIMDFAVYFEVPRDHLDTLHNYDLSSDHSPIIITYGTLCQHYQTNIKMSHL